jgi:hypothetical protein
MPVQDNLRKATDTLVAEKKFAVGVPRAYL